MQSFSVPCSLIFPPPLVEQMFTFGGVADALISTMGGDLSIPLVPEVLLTLCPVGGYTWGARLLAVATDFLLHPLWPAK